MRPNIGKMIAGTAVILAIVVFSGLFQNGFSFQSQHPEKTPDTIPTPGRVTLLDLGADRCVPCKMMAPILKDLQKAYAGRADIIFIDVWKNKSQAKKYGIRAIPTQIFYNEKGEEVRRHTGFMDKKTIVEHLSKLGVSPPETLQDS